ncbi:hypothetical protein BB560_002726 [Smittium megazygosporum]|uniref:Alpha N-terminal protein methyltransferase 1 n=1 Tax=Smittium megazygosporum TaxID=133381 RepID=A0A2T9ZE36_9FUNG|nr:hypothetical protein BB560_002726 [Smittium megazygosporum]
MSDKIKARNDWYEDADKYWETVDSSDNGMLGGLLFVNHPDIKDSSKMIQNLLETRFKRKEKEANSEQHSELYALDCGAGIGRVTKNLLSKYFDKVDMVEQNSKFVSEAKTSNLKQLTDSGIVVNFFNFGLQDFTPMPSKYDVIWCQWVLSHLTDDDLVGFFKRCVTGLKPNGVICVKENTCSTDYIVDNKDSSVTRSLAVYESIFKRARLRILETRLQSGFPKTLFRVRMWVLSPT